MYKLTNYSVVKTIGIGDMPHQYSNGIIYSQLLLCKICSTLYNINYTLKQNK